MHKALLLHALGTQPHLDLLRASHSAMGGVLLMPQDGNLSSPRDTMGCFSLSLFLSLSLCRFLEGFGPHRRVQAAQSHETLQSKLSTIVKSPNIDATIDRWRNRRLVQPKASIYDRFCRANHECSSIHRIQFWQSTLNIFSQCEMTIPLRPQRSLNSF